MNSCGRAGNLRHKGDSSPVCHDVECICRRAGAGKARDQAGAGARGQEHDLQVARQAAVCTTSYAGRDLAGTSRDAGIAA